MIADTINAGFEFAASFAVLHHCWHAWRDKEVKGTSIAAVAFFAAWGIWNLFYYPYLGQWHSFFAGIFVFVANGLWLVMLIHYRRQQA